MSFLGGAAQFVPKRDWFVRNLKHFFRRPTYKHACRQRICGVGFELAYDNLIADWKWCHVDFRSLLQVGSVFEIHYYLERLGHLVKNKKFRFFINLNGRSIFDICHHANFQLK